RRSRVILGTLSKSQCGGHLPLAGSLAPRCVSLAHLGDFLFQLRHGPLDTAAFMPYLVISPTWGV
ncbi:hypothetical protein UFOVP1191_122, partial [uncultured Caudovirales phage]